MITPEDEASRAVRQYFNGLARRYVPSLVFFVGLGLILALVPSVPPDSANQTSSGVTSEEGMTSVPGSTPGAGGASTEVPRVGTGQVGGVTPRPGGTAGSPGGGAVPPPGSTSAAQGVSVGGVRCGSGVRQLSWSQYAPYCVPAWSGTNGGATAPGVTAKTVTLTYRKARTGSQAYVASLSGGSLPSDDAVIADLQTYIDLFNKKFELYGRKVVLKPYDGQGDWVLEGSGQDLQGAQADAVTARQLGAFGDVSFLAYVTQPYAQALVQEKVISFGISANTQANFNRWAPYAYSHLLTAERLAGFNANLICKRLNAAPAVYSGDYKDKTRKFGLIVANTPNLMYTGDLTQTLVSKGCGMKFALRANYDIAQGQQQAISYIAQMKAAGVTTVVCECGGDMMIYAPSQADSQDYHPEWLVFNGGDSFNRTPDQDQWSRHAISMNDYVFQNGVPKSRSEAYRAFKVARPRGEPENPTYSGVYFTLMQVFSALQQAGPRLTPHTFMQGMFSLPTSGLGSAGIWTPGKGVFTPLSHAHVAMWDTNKPSPFDGKPGTWVPCDSRSWYSLLDPRSWGQSRQLGC